jgi:hypothetical protein
LFGNIVTCIHAYGGRPCKLVGLARRQGSKHQATNAMQEIVKSNNASMAQ